MQFFTPFPIPISRTLLGAIFLIRKRNLLSIFFLLNSFLYMTTLNVIVLPMKRRICSNLSKWSYLPSYYYLLPTLKRDLGEVNQMTNLQFVFPAPNAIFVTKRVIRPLSAILNLLEKIILTVLKVLQTLLLNAQYL